MSPYDREEQNKDRQVLDPIRILICEEEEEGYERNSGKRAVFLFVFFLAPRKTYFPPWNFCWTKFHFLDSMAFFGGNSILLWWNVTGRNYALIFLYWLIGGEGSIFLRCKHLEKIVIIFVGKLLKTEKAALLSLLNFELASLHWRGRYTECPFIYLQGWRGDKFREEKTTYMIIKKEYRVKVMAQLKIKLY